jgi:SAM-dependent methyltransferase
LRVAGPVWRIRRVALWSETIFWALWLRQNRGEIARRVSDDLPFPDAFFRYIEAIDRDTIDVLEVGAGPLPSIGSKHPRKQVRVTAIDFLAPQYDRLLDRHKLNPPVRSIFADAERLEEQFGANAFDFVYATNCVDHMERPLAAILSMAAILRPGGYAVLLHKIDEGVEQDYAGLHAWNLNAEGQRFIVWNASARHDVNDVLRDSCDVTAELRGDHVYAEIRKRA